MFIEPKRNTQKFDGPSGPWTEEVWKAIKLYYLNAEPRTKTSRSNKNTQK